MGPESPRITELRRRVESDPSSIVFAQLAEEYRRAGNYEAAERYCRTGLARHPAYLSARVTLGRTLIELNQLEDAEQELQRVLTAAPDNLAALRGVAEIQQRLGKLDVALEYFRRALALSRHDPDLEELVERLSRSMSPPPPAAPPPSISTLDFDELLASLGGGDQSAPPSVEALLDESSVRGPQSSVEEESSVLSPQSSVLGPESLVGGPEPDWMTGPLPEFTPPIAEEPERDMIESSAAVAPDTPQRLDTLDATEEAEAPDEPDASVAREGRLEATDEMILDELEAWLKAIKR